jgi:hypothetical protein
MYKMDIPNDRKHRFNILVVDTTVRSKVKFKICLTVFRFVISNVKWSHTKVSCYVSDMCKYQVSYDNLQV